jgi:hypothetical protein
MNEVEKHYATQGAADGPGDNGGRAGSSSSSPADIARSAIDQAVSSARSGLKGASDTTDTAKRAASDVYDKASSWASDSYDSAARNAEYARRRSAEELARTRRNVGEFVEGNPIMIGVAGLAVGLLVGALLPSTRRENKVFGRYADEVRDQGKRYARELAEQGRQLVEEGLDTVASAAKPDQGGGQPSSGTGTQSQAAGAAQPRAGTGAPHSGATTARPRRVGRRSDGSPVLGRPLCGAAQRLRPVEPGYNPNLNRRGAIFGHGHQARSAQTQTGPSRPRAPRSSGRGSRGR